MGNANKRLKYGIGGTDRRNRRIMFSLSNEEYVALRQACANLEQPMSVVIYKMSHALMQLCCRYKNLDQANQEARQSLLAEIEETIGSAAA